MQGMSSTTTMRAALALLLIVYLVDCTTGSCLSYGHSCWGAHGKRSSKAPSSAPDWYITRLLRRMAANSELNNSRNLDSRNNGDIYQMAVDESPNKFLVEADTPEFGAKPEAKPMLDDELLSNMKFWQMMKAASEDN